MQNTCAVLNQQRKYVHTKAHIQRECFDRTVSSIPKVHQIEQKFKLIIPLKTKNKNKKTLFHYTYYKKNYISLNTLHSTTPHYKGSNRTNRIVSSLSTSLAAPRNNKLHQNLHTELEYKRKSTFSCLPILYF